MIFRSAARHSTRLIRFVLLAAAGLVSGCFMSGVRPRTADLPRAGSVSGGVAMTLAGYAPGHFHLAGGEQSHGDSAQRYVVHPLAYLAPHIYNTVGHLSYGALDWLQLTLEAGMQQQGLEVRFGAVDEDRGQPLSLAVSLAGMYRPFQDPRSALVRLEVDVSRRIRNIVPLLNLGLSYGPERHAINLDKRLSRPCGSFADDGCSEYGPPRQISATRDELRLTIGPGVAFRAGDCHQVSLGVQPYVTLVSSELRGADCVGCGYLEPVTGFGEAWGIHFAIDYTYLSQPPALVEGPGPTTPAGAE